MLRGAGAGRRFACFSRLSAGLEDPWLRFDGDEVDAVLFDRLGGYECDSTAESELLPIDLCSSSVEEAVDLR
jgi:hypothetical protein